MPPHHLFCKKCGSRFGFELLKKTETGGRFRCKECGRVSYKSGRYVRWEVIRILEREKLEKETQ